MMKTYLVTGATSGIGKATAFELANHGGNLLLVSRTEEKGEAAVKEITAVTGNKNLELYIADLSSQAENQTAHNEASQRGRD